MSKDLPSEPAQTLPVEAGLALEAVDGCMHDFQTMASTVLPAHFQRMTEAMLSPLALADFTVSGMGVRTLLKRHGHHADFSGCYALIEKGVPIYIGISRTVFSRLRQHVTGRTHFDASLAYRMAHAEAPHGKTRAAAMADKNFEAMFLVKRAYLQGLSAAVIDIENSIELYLFEVYAAITLRTARWNSFRTH